MQCAYHAFFLRITTTSSKWYIVYAFERITRMCHLLMIDDMDLAFLCLFALNRSLICSHIFWQWLMNSTLLVTCFVSEHLLMQCKVQNMVVIVIPFRFSMFRHHGATNFKWKSSKQYMCTLLEYATAMVHTCFSTITRRKLDAFSPCWRCAELGGCGFGVQRGRRRGWCVCDHGDGELGF